MIAAAALLALMVFLLMITAGRFILAGKFSETKHIKNRIFDNASLPGNYSEGNFRRQEHYSDIETLQKIFEKHPFSQKLALSFKRAGYKVSLSIFFLSYIAAGSLILLVGQIFLPLLPSAALAALCIYFPFFQLRRKNRAYVEKFSEHLPDATAIISSALKTGQSIDRAMENVGRTAPYPVSVEFQILSAEIKLGLPIEAALKNLHKRVSTPELKIFITGISIQQELGGNLSEIMENLEKTIRERYALQREIKVLSSQGIFSMWALFCLPFAFAAVFALSDPTIITEYIHSPFGIRLITVSAIMQMAAFFWMNKAIKIE